MLNILWGVLKIDLVDSVCIDRVMLHACDLERYDRARNVALRVVCDRIDPIVCDGDVLGFCYLPDLRGDRIAACTVKEQVKPS